MRKVILLTLCLGLLAAPAWAFSVDFSTGFTPAGGKNYGATLNAANSANYIPADLTITARSGMVATDEPLTVVGKPGTVFWGLANDLVGKNDYSGLGVQDSGAGGSKGISGDVAKADKMEALIFTFANPLDVDSIKLTLAGVNDGDTAVFHVKLSPELEYTFTVFSSDIVTYDFSSFTGASGNISQFAVEATSGHFIVSGLQYNVPVPPTVLLLGSGLLGLVGLRWRRRKTDV